MQIYSDLAKYNMVDAIVATGASIIDMDFLKLLDSSIIKVLNFKMILNFEIIISTEFMILILMKNNYKFVIRPFVKLLIA